MPAPTNETGNGQTPNADTTPYKDGKPAFVSQPNGDWLFSGNENGLFAVRYIRTSRFSKIDRQDRVKGLFIIADRSWPITVTREGGVGAEAVDLTQHVGEKGQFDTQIVYLYEGTSEVRVGKYTLVPQEVLTQEGYSLFLQLTIARKIYDRNQKS